MEVCSPTFSVVLAVSLLDSLLLLPPFWDYRSECCDSWVDFSWDFALKFSLEFSLKLSSKLTLGVGSLIGSICSRCNGNCNNLISLYSWKALISSKSKSSEAICFTSENVSFCRKRSSNASSSWVNIFTFIIVVKSLEVPFGSYCLHRNVANFRDFIIYASLHACPKSCSENAPHYIGNVDQMAFFYSFNPLLSQRYPYVFWAISLAINLSGTEYGRRCGEEMLSNTLIYVNVSSTNHLATGRISASTSMENLGHSCCRPVYI